jgi:Flp pilus assembly protein TadD
MIKDVHRRTIPVLVILGALALVAGCATTGSVADSGDALSVQQSMAAGDDAARRGDFERAVAYYVRAVGQEPSIEGWLRIGAACTRLGQSQRALHAYLKVIELDPAHAESHEGAGLEYLALKKFEAAREHLTQAATLEPRRWRSHNALGILADQRKEHAAAIAHYEAALDINPSSAMLLNNLGFSRFLSRDLTQAALDLYAATALDPAYKAAWSNLAMVYAERGWYADAVETLLKAGDQAGAYNDVGYVALQRNDLVQAEQLLSEAVRLSPVYYPVAHRNLEAVRVKLQSAP